MDDAVIKGASSLLIHTPDLVRYGSKPEREISKDHGLLNIITSHLRSFEQCLSYAPNQVFIGNQDPDRLHAIEYPWHQHPLPDSASEGRFGGMIPQDELYAFLKIADEFDLVWLEDSFLETLRHTMTTHPLLREQDLQKLQKGHSQEEITGKINTEASLPLYSATQLIGCLHRHHDEDETLFAKVLLENLVGKASGAMALRHLLKTCEVKPDQVGYLLSCSEEAVGDRYNRGGGNLAKAIGEMGGCVNATGSDVKAFCSAPVCALVHAASLVKSGVFDNVVVVGGGCLPKLGMKYQGHLKHNMPILEDVLGCMAFLVGKDDGRNPVLRLDSIGQHHIGAGSSQQAIMESLVVKPLQKLGLKLSHVDKYATEMHNPEVTLPQGSGNVPLNNYRMIAALAVLNGEIQRNAVDDFVKRFGMPGFSPTQGHIPAAVPFLGHALEGMRSGRFQKVMFLAKGSLFLGRMSQLSDGMSFLLEKNPKSP